MSGIMDDSWGKWVTPNFVEVVKFLQPSKLLDLLFQSRLLDSEDYKSLRGSSSGTEEDKSRKLLTEILPKKGSQSFEKFREVLRSVADQAFILTDILGYPMPVTMPLSDEESSSGSLYAQPQPSQACSARDIPGQNLQPDPSVDEANESPLQTSSPDHETEKSAGDRVAIDEPVSGTNSAVPLQRKRKRKRQTISGKGETSGSTSQTASRKRNTGKKKRRRVSQPRARWPARQRVNPLKQIYGEGKRMIEQMIHPSDKARQPLRLSLANTIKTVERL